MVAPGLGYDLAINNPAQPREAPMNLTDQQLTTLIEETVERRDDALRWRNSCSIPSLEWQTADDETDRLATRVARLEQVRQELRDLQVRINALAPSVMTWQSGGTAPEGV